MLKKITTIIVTVLALSAMFFVTTSTVAAQDTLSQRIGDVTKATDETTLITAVLRLSIPLASFALTGLSLYAGYLMLTSQGDPERINEAREIMTNAVLGFALIGLSVAVLLLIQNVLRIPGLNP